MWEIQIGQAYYDEEDNWGGIGHPVALESKFGDTKTLLTEIQEFLKEVNDDKPLTINPDEIQELWDEARKDPRKTYCLSLRSDDYKDENFTGTVAIELSLSYNMDEARKRQTPETQPEPKPEQLDLFA